MNGDQLASHRLPPCGLIGAQIDWDREDMEEMEEPASGISGIDGSIDREGIVQNKPYQWA